MNKLIIVLVSVLFLFSCSDKKEDGQAKVSFYYWKTIFRLDATEKKVLTDNGTDKIYIRYFDVSLKGKEAIPLSPIVFAEKPGNYKIVPVVYIKNEVMLESSVELKSMARNITDYIAQINTKNGISWDEIQIDCDWTLNSKERFLTFIEELKAISNKKLSATIRLHQVKYFRQTGIPNVDKGVLMYYNMGSIAPGNLNSIYDRNIAQSYIKSLGKFPLQLDIALPVYSWGIHIRNNKVLKVISKLEEKSLENDPHFKRTDKMHFAVIKSVIRAGRYFKEGDVVKIEGIAKDDLETMAKDLSENLSGKPGEIIFYDLDSFNFKTYNDDKQFFKKVADWF